LSGDLPMANGILSGDLPIVVLYCRTIQSRTMHCFKEFFSVLFSVFNNVNVLYCSTIQSKRYEKELFSVFCNSSPNYESS
jgi:hypothetical protein